MKTVTVDLVHEQSNDKSQKSPISIQQHPTSTRSQTVECPHCEKEMKLKVRSTRSIKIRYLLVLLPSLIIGGYLIYNRVLNQGIDTLLTSLILYTLFGFIGYLAIVYYLLRPFMVIASVTNSDTHNIS